MSKLCDITFPIGMFPIHFRSYGWIGLINFMNFVCFHINVIHIVKYVHKIFIVIQIGLYFSSLFPTQGNVCVKCEIGLRGLTQCNCFPCALSQLRVWSGIVNALNGGPFSQLNVFHNVKCIGR